MPYRLSSGLARGALLEILALEARMCDREVDHPLQSIRFSYDIDSSCGPLPKIPLVEVSQSVRRRWVN